ncbi:MAG: RNA polymerase sigma factor (sigma-70 family) [Cyclobacteriaceae bacterium]|jgi:RNA polymerase sigma factor (sigma-70 family)
MSASFDHNILPSAQKMYRFAWSILRDEDSAHDVVQECLTKIWHKRDTLQSIQNHEAWIMRIVRNQCYDWVKSQSRMTVIDESHDEEEQKGADHDLIYKDQEKWLNQTLSLLSEVQREIFHLREIESFSYQEIADAMSLSINEVKVYLHRARQKVRAEMLTIESYGIAN